jgi:hypothetical protein
MKKKAFKRLYRALRCERKAWASKFDSGSVYPIPFLPDVCYKIARRESVSVDALITINRNLHFCFAVDRWF